MKMYSIHDPEFRTFGRVIDNPFYDHFAKAAEEIAIPETGCSYMASVPAFESEEALSYYRGYFGDMDVQLGYCWGRNDMLNALEWHKSSEVHCALADMVLLLGDFHLMENDTFDSSNVMAFTVKAGEAVEIFETTLHFCPAMPEGGVFKNVVILPRGTNTPLEHPTADRRLIARNKWLIIHPEFKKQVDLGRVIGITGENIHVK